MSSATRRPISSESIFISMMIGTPRCRSSTSRSVRDAEALPRGTDSRHGAPAKCQPASTRASSAAVRAATGPVALVVRSSVGSCTTTGTPSADRCTSSSSPSAPARRPSSKAASVFSGASALPPRCANTRGRPRWKKAIAVMLAARARRCVTPFGRAAAIGSTVCPIPRRSPRWATCAAPSSAARFATATSTKRCATT